MVCCSLAYEAGEYQQLKCFPRAQRTNTKYTFSNNFISNYWKVTCTFKTILIEDLHVMEE